MFIVGKDVLDVVGSVDKLGGIGVFTTVLGIVGL
jgi:hypothetical protein